MLEPALAPCRPARRLRGGLSVLAFLAATIAAGAEPSSNVSAAARFRQPVALGFAGGGARLIVANRLTGSVSVIDTHASRLIAEHDVGRGLADLGALPDGRHWLAVDPADDALLLLEERAGAVRLVARSAVSADPISLCVVPGEASCVVASRWSRRLSFFDVERARGRGSTPALRASGTLGLPFSPRAMAAIRGGAKLLVADAFGGALAVVDVRRRTVDRIVALGGHNIGGLAVTPDDQAVVISHQVLNAPARTVSEDVQWGILLNNDLRVVRLERLLAASAGGDAMAESLLVNLGEVSRGGGDPGALAFAAGGTLILALGGVDQVATGRSAAHLQRRIAVGRRPTALAVSPDGRTVAVAETLDDTVAFLDVESGEPKPRVALGPRREPSLAERGERLFFDARLSRGGWMSCHSCHTEGHSNGLNVDTFGDGEFGAPKRVPSLLGVGETGPWSWNGRFVKLDDQVHQSTLTTMQGAWPTDAEVAELTAYLRALAPPPPAVTGSLSAAASRGRELFTRECAQCHAPPRYTSAGHFDVGLTDAAGNREFNPPSLRGVGTRSPLLHDGRAATLDDVFRRVRHPAGDEWGGDEIADLVAFLKTL